MRFRSSRQYSYILALAMAVFSIGCQSNGGKGSPSSRAMKGSGGGAVPVVVAKAVERDVPIDLQVVGNVEPYLTVNVKAQVSGELTQVFFREGDFVKKGDQLFTIDSRIFEAQLQQAQSNLAKDEAVLAQVEANLSRDEAQQKYTDAEAVRYKRLLDQRLISREQEEQVRTSAEAIAAAVKADRAAVQSARATVEASKAAVENIKVTLSYTIIRSPVNGRTGNLDVKQGNVINPSTNLMTIHQVEPIYVSFSVPQAQRPSVRNGQTVMVATQDGTPLPAAGNVSFIDNAVDTSTGTIRLKATFPNPDHRLWPGEFVRVKLRLRMQPNSLLIPTQAVQTGQDGTYVFVVTGDRVESRPVVTGLRVDQDIVVEKGLGPGDVVVTEGQLRLAPGTRVQYGVGPR